MKKLILTLITSIFISSVIFAHGYGPRGTNENNENGWRQMNSWHNIMHGISITSEAIDKGVNLEVTAESEAILTSLSRDLKLDEETLSRFFAGTVVSVQNTEQSVTIQITSEDADTIKKLQYWEGKLVYQFLRNQMHDQFGGRTEVNQHMGGRGGWGHGFGPGMMYDRNWRGGYGSDMMDEGDNRGFGRGMMNSYDGNQSGYYGGHMM